MTSVTVLALAIGANTAMFSVLNAVLLRPLPYPAPEQLTMLWTERPSQNLREGRSAYWNVEQWRRQSTSFADMAIFDPVSVTLTTAEEAEHISVARISPNFFPLLGVQPLHGRSFSAEEAGQRQRLALISHRFWQARFGGAFDAIGASIELDGVSSRIIGILPPGFPVCATGCGCVGAAHDVSGLGNPSGPCGASGSWFVVGRLRPNVTVEQAQAEMSAIARRLDEQMPASERNRGISVVPLSLQLTGPKPRLALWMLTGAVFCVLLIAATNVASLSLARSASREREIAIRAALGASRGRIVRQLLAESLTLAVISGLLGLVGSAWRASASSWRSSPADLARLNEVSLDPYVLGWALALCLLTGILVGLAPAITMARRNLRPSGQDGGRGIAGGVATRGIRRALVVTEFATGDHSAGRRRSPDPKPVVGGERRSGIQARAGAFDADRQPGLQGRARSVPTFTTACSSRLNRCRAWRAPASSAIFSSAATRNGSSPPKGTPAVFRERLRFRSDEISGGFFKALGTPLLRGRFFSSGDGPDSPRVAIVNDAMARRLWPGRDAVGKRFKLGPGDSDRPWFTVVGVVGDMRRQGLENEPIPQMFEPLAQNPSRLATLLVRTSMDDPLQMVGTLQAAVRRVDKHAPLYGVTTLEKRLGDFLTQRRFQTSLLIGFSVVALLMAAIGIYGLIQYSIAMRTHEIGIRMAVGAQAGEIFRMIIGEGLKLSLAGLVARAGGSFVAGPGRLESPVRRYRHGSVDVRRCLAAADRGGGGSLLFPGAARHEGRADGGIAAGVNRGEELPG